MRKELFIYSTGWMAAIAAIGGTAVGTVTIAADAPFELHYITASVRQGGAGLEVLITAWAGTVQIKFVALGKDLSNLAVPLACLQGSGQLPYVISPPLRMSINSSMVVSVASNIATRTEVSVDFHGHKVYAP